MIGELRRQVPVHFETPVTTDDLASKLDRIQYETQEGPRVDAIYATEPRILLGVDRDVALLLAAHAGAALAAARSVEAAEMRVANLERALLSRDVIGQAKGMLMAQRGISADEAFDVRAASQKLDIKLTEIAEALASRRIEL